MPDAASEITDSEILSLIEKLDGPLSGPAADDDSEPEDVGHGNEIKASHSREDSQDLDTADHEGEDDDPDAETGEPSKGESTEDSEEPDTEDDGESEEPEREEEALKPAAAALKEENETLKRQLEKAAPIVLTPTQDNPLSDMTTEAQVLGYVKQMRSLRDWCFQNLQGGEVTTKEGNTVELSASQVGKRLSRAEAIISDYAPDRLAYIKDLNSSRETARKIYPQLFDAKSEWSKIANSYISRHPAMLHDPNYEMVIGDAIAGMQARIMKAKSQKSQANSKTTAPTQRAIRPNIAPSSKGSVTKSTKARNDFMQTGSKKDLEAMILATL